MKINYLLAKEIYGLTPWFVDSHSLISLSTILDNVRAGIDLDIPEEKYNSIFLHIDSAKIVDRPYGSLWNPGQLDSKENFEAVGVININGPITVSGGMSSYGIDYIASNMRKMSEDSRIKAFVIVGNSGGGASMAVEIMTEVINEVKQKMPVYSVVSKGGMAASAMYGILAATDKIYSEHEMNIVGSAGTMVQFDGRKANTEDPDGVKHIRLYASKSTHKNKAFEDALNHDNYELIINELLDPMNERFLSSMLENRPALKGTSYDNGHTLFSKDAIGTFIDGIKSFSEVVEEAMSDYNQNYKQKGTKNKNTNKQINSKMDIAELKSNHPDVYKSVFEAGVNSEKDRTGVWMAHFKTDPEAVVKGVESGAEISATEREKLLIKATSLGNLESIKNESPKDLKTKESESTEKTEEEKEFEAMYGNLAKTI